ncbi:unnamed protein product [Closterium sp. NIES-53]
MESHHEMESFAQGLHNFLGSVDSKRLATACVRVFTYLIFMLEMAQPPPAVAGAGCASPLHRGVREGVLQAEHHQVLGAWSALQRASGGADADIAPEVRDRMAGGTGGVEVHAEEAPCEEPEAGRGREGEEGEAEGG